MLKRVLASLSTEHRLLLAQGATATCMMISVPLLFAFCEVAFAMHIENLLSRLICRQLVQLVQREAWHLVSLIHLVVLTVLDVDLHTLHELAEAVFPEGLCYDVLITVWRWQHINIEPSADL